MGRRVRANLRRVRSCRRELGAEAYRTFGSNEGISVRLEIDGRVDPEPGRLRMLARILAGPQPLEIIDRSGARIPAPIAPVVRPAVRAEILGGRLKPVDLERAPGVDDPRYIDIVSVSEAGVVLVVAHARAWGATEDEVVRLSGEVARYPAAAGKPVRIRLACLEPPPDDLRLYFRRLRRGLADDGITFDVVVFQDGGRRTLPLD